MKKTFQDKYLSFIYSFAPLRMAMRLISNKTVSKIAGTFLSSGASAFLIKPFIRMHGIQMDDYEEKKYNSFNDFFIRRIRRGKRNVSMSENVLVSPSDGFVSAYHINENSHFRIKGSTYSTASLIRNRKLAAAFSGGTCVAVRLCVTDYHHYIYADTAKVLKRFKIPGVLYTVNPAALEHEKVYKENAREYEVLASKNFGIMIQMEVGALMVGKIVNDCKEKYVKRGMEKGHFEFGGSTVILLLKKNACVIRKEFFDAAMKNEEIRVNMGENIGVKPGKAEIYNGYENIVS